MASGTPAEIIWDLLAAKGVEEFDFAAGEDKLAWSSRQSALNIQLVGKLSQPLTCDGVPGPATVAALKLAGYVDGIWALGKG